jgi:hypothetical protein
MDVKLSEQGRSRRFPRLKLALVTGAIVLGIAMCVGVSKASGDAATTQSVSIVMLHRWTKQDGNHGLSLAIQVAKTAFRSGEKIEVEMLIRNDSGKAQRIFVPGLHGRVKYLPTEGTGSEVFPVNHPMVFGRPAKQDGTDTMTLQPGEFVGRKFIFDQSRPGDIILTASYAEKLDASEYLLVVESSQLKVTAPK